MSALISSYFLQRINLSFHVRADSVNEDVQLSIDALKIEKKVEKLKTDSLHYIVI